MRDFLNSKYCSRVRPRQFGGKNDGRRHFTTSFNESVVVAETSYQMLEVVTLCNRERSLPPSITTKVLTFPGGKKCNEDFRVV